MSNKNSIRRFRKNQDRRICVNEFGDETFRTAADLGTRRPFDVVITDHAGDLLGN